MTHNKINPHNEKSKPDDLMNVEYFRKGYFDTVNQEQLALPFFGLFILSIKEAAKLIAVDMWFAGEITDVKEPENWDGTEQDPQLILSLEKKITDLEQKLHIAIDAGTLEPVKKARNLDEKLIPEKTYINYKTMHDWLKERGYECGDVLERWSENETEIAMRLCEELTYLRSINKAGSSEYQSFAFYGMRAKNGDIIDTEITHVLAANKALIIENQHLTTQLDNAKTEQVSKLDRPLGTNERRKLLSVIAALCDYSAIKPEARGTASQISQLADDIGLKVSEDTVFKMLAEIRKTLLTGNTLKNPMK